MKATDEDGRTCLTYARAALSIATAKQQKIGSVVTSDNQVVACNNLIDLLAACGCQDVAVVPGSGTLPRRRGSQALPPLEKVTSSVI